MMRRESFGRRQGTGSAAFSHAQPHRPNDRAAIDDGDRTIRHLDQNTARLRLAGQIVACLGILLTFAAAINWPVHPLSTTLVDNRIYVPLSLASEIESLGLEASTREMFDGRSAMISSLYLAILIPLCWVSIFRRHWIVVAMITAILMFPWEYFGFPVPYRPIQLTCLAVLVPLRLMRFTKWMKVLVIIAALVSGIPVLKFATSLTRQIAPNFDEKYVPYNVLSASRLARDAEKMQQWRILTSPTQNANETPEKTSARAFALAQERYKQSDAIGVHATLARLDRLDQPLNLFERHRIATMREFSAFDGAMGPAAQLRASRSYASRSTLAWFAMILGGLAALLGPFSQILHASIRKRTRRIKTVQKELDAATQSNNVAARYAASNSNDGGSEQGVKSIAALDARGTVEILQNRFRRHAVAAGSLLGLAALAWGAKLMFGLPPVDQNSAFETIALLDGVARYGTASGYFPGKDYGHTATFSLMHFLSPFVFLAAIFLFFLRKSKIPALVALLIGVIFNQAGPYLITPDPIYQAPAAALNDSHRRSLAKRTRPASKSGSSTRPAKPRGVNIRDTVAFVARDHAAFTLAQIAYVENDPVKAAVFLNRIRHYNSFRPPYAKRRLIIMREWVTARGQAISQDTWTTMTSIPPATARKMALIAETIAIGALICSLLLIVLAGLVDRRIRRLSTLVTQRSQGEMANRSERIVTA